MAPPLAFALRLTHKRGMFRLALALLATDAAPPTEPAKAVQTASVTANEALRRYRELTSALPTCKRDTADSDDVIVCAPGPKDRFRAWNGDPIPEPKAPRYARDDTTGDRRVSEGLRDRRCDDGQSFGRCGLPKELQR
ncbi:MAG TPA: hypothetical protein VF649_13650 [Sphingomonas sp.]|jgi:hypothetical protein|uniref:hypothetical protein n=1 Tax=Sphingomonas sp. TaxID=28214 RepID=UPI002EDB5C5F